MHILVLQHERIEHPAAFRPLMAGAGWTWDAVHLNEGAALPPLDGYDALWVMGGPMDTWQEAAHPWLREEKAFIREAVKIRQMPFFGLCLGHQLLAEALGGAVGKGTPEVGVCDVRHTAPSPFTAGLADPLEVLQWHGAEVTRPPDGAQVLCASPACAVQAMQWGEHAFSTQFHLEVEPDTVANWAAIPAYAAALEAAMGADAVARLEAEVQPRMPGFAAAAGRVFDNWRASALSAMEGAA